MMTLEKYLTKNSDILFRGYPHFGPSKCGVSKNDQPSTAYDPTFLLQKPFPLKKCGCLQKTSAHSNKIWPRYKGFKSKKNIFKNFHLFALQTKNVVNQRGFKIFPKKFSTSSVITSFFYMWFNIDTMGHEKSQTSAKAQVFPIFILRSSLSTFNNVHFSVWEGQVDS